MADCSKDQLRWAVVRRRRIGFNQFNRVSEDLEDKFSGQTKKQGGEEVSTLAEVI
jgi:hypothetical protein